MTKSEKKWWEQERAKGYDRYLLHSISRRGLPAGILIALFMVVSSWLRHRPTPSFLELFSWFAAFSLMFGSLIGRHNWRDNEQNYQKPTEDDDHVA